jgi:hypothetical protein
MSIDERLEEAREDSWEASRTTFEVTYLVAREARDVSEAVYWAASWESSCSWVTYWASQCKKGSYKAQVEILKGLLDEHRQKTR